MANDINIRIGARLDGLQRGIKKAQSQLSRFSDFAEQVGGNLTTRLTLPILGVGGAAVKTFAEFDRIEKGLATLNGGVKGGAESFKRLNDIVLDTRTTLDLRTAALGAQRLQGAGLSAAFAESTIKQLGIAATVSGSAIDDVGGVIRQFTQIIGKNKIEQEDLNTILDRMPALGAVIKEEFGTSTAEGIRDTGISMQEFVARVTKAIEQNESFQSVQGGLAKSFESFNNAVKVGIRPLGEAIAQSLNLEENLKKLSDFITRTSQAFADLNPGVQKFIVGGAAAAAALGPLVLGIGAAVKVSIALSAAVKLITGSVLALGKSFIAFLASPAGIAVAAIVGLTAAVVTAYKRSETFRATVDGIGAVISNFASKAIQRLKDVVGVLGDILSFDFAGLTNRLTEIVGRDSGKTAGEAFATAYAESIAKTSASNFGNRGRLGGGVERNVSVQTNTSTFDFDPTPTLPIAETTTQSDPYSVYNDSADNLIGSLVSISEEALRTGTSLREMAAQSGLQADLGRSVEDLGLKVQLTGTQFKSVSDGILGQYNSRIKSINDQSIVFGDSFDALGAKVSAVKDAINSALEEGFSPFSDTIGALQKELKVLEGELEKSAKATQTAFERIKEFKDGFGATFSSGLADTVTSIFEGIDTEKVADLNQQLKEQRDILSDREADEEAKAAAQSRIDLLREEIKQEKQRGNAILATAKLAINAAKEAIQAQLAKAIAGAIAGEATKGLLGLVTAGVAVAGISALFNSKVPKLSSGGIIPPGFEGDRFPAFLNSGEAVIPIDKLLNAIEGGGGSGEFILRGQDLVLAMERASYSKARITGR